VIITSKNETNILKSEIWSQIQAVDDLIQNQTIHYEGQSFQYKDMCSKWLDSCHQNDILELGDMLQEFEAGKTKIGYPVGLNPNSFKVMPTGHFLGGIELTPDKSDLESAKSVLLYYFVKSKTASDVEK